MKYLGPLLLLVSAGLVLGCAGVKQTPSTTRVREVALGASTGSGGSNGSGGGGPANQSTASRLQWRVR